ncbi:hypothetical protein V0288_22770 [Pannus brasiliensis CCIBt3594]|uniref:Transposase n=1 Tax=Pannus brasiliensis CCIBt3594 TaxID=1427578 RepID=A0AAW9QXG3_9CHRO
MKKAVSDYESPFDASIYPHTSKFFLLLLKKEQEPTDLGKSLDKKIVKPFKKIRRQWSKDFREDPSYQLATIDSESGKELYQMPGRGSGKYEIGPLNRNRGLESYFNGFIDEFTNSPEKMVIVFIPELNSYMVIEKKYEYIYQILSG